jgi:AraC-like DNA-binding protein
MQRLVIIESGFDHPKLRRVRDHITRHISESYRLERAADIASARPKYLCELFRKHVGVSFGVWFMGISHGAREGIAHEHQMATHRRCGARGRLLRPNYFRTAEDIRRDAGYDWLWRHCPDPRALAD